MHLVLASQSPRRKEILEYFGIPFLACSPQFDEKTIHFIGNPYQYAQELAKGKAASLQHAYADSILLGADTVVYKEGRLFEKPADEEDAFAMLKALSGESHTVITALALVYKDLSFLSFQETKVWLHSLTDNQIHAYQSAIPVLDKAGGYAIQNSGGIIVKKIEGCFYNVMGLPLSVLELLLAKIGINLWDHLS